MEGNVRIKIIDRGEEDYGEEGYNNEVEFREDI